MNLFIETPRPVPTAPAPREVPPRPRESETAPAPPEYSQAQQTYRDELAFDRRRARARRRSGALRALATVVAVPLLLAVVFLGSYILFCILNGASVDELGTLLVALFEQVGRGMSGLMQRIGS